MARLLVTLGALSGLLGVALAAAGRHGGAANLSTAAEFLLFHAPALLALAALVGTGLVHGAAGLAAGFSLSLGLALFCGDLASRDWLQRPLFPRAAPIGGIVLMIGWALMVIAALLRRG